MEVQLGSGMHPPGLSSKLAFEKARAQSCVFPCLGSDVSPPPEGHQRKMREDRPVRELSCA